MKCLTINPHSGKEIEISDSMSHLGYHDYGKTRRLIGFLSIYTFFFHKT